MINPKRSFQFAATIVKDARISKDLTQMDLARELGFTSPQLVSNVERGMCALPIESWKKAAAVLGIDGEVFVQAHLADQEISVRKISGIRPKTKR